MKRVCSIEGCGKRHFGLGWCSRHYARFKRHGDPQAGATHVGAPASWLAWWVDNWQQFSCDEAIEHHHWPHAHIGGYPRISAEGRRGTLVSRLMCAIQNGPAPDPSSVARHLCGRGADGCIRPACLVWGTRAENEADKLIHGTHNRGERGGAHKLTEAQVHEIRRLVAAGGVRHIDVARMFGVSRTTVSEIAAHKKWAWLS